MLLQTNAILVNVVTHTNSPNLEGTFNCGNINIANYKGRRNVLFLEDKMGTF